MEEKKHKRSDQTKQIITDAMFTLLEKHDFEDITVNDICVRAGIGRTTFYFYFEDKYDLVVQSIAGITYRLLNVDLCNKEELTRAYSAFVDEVEQRCFALQHLIKQETIFELQYKLDKAFEAHFISLYKAKCDEGVKFKYPYHMLGIYNCGGEMRVMSWWLRNKMCVEKEEMVKYLVERTHRSASLTIED